MAVLNVSVLHITHSLFVIKARLGLDGKNKDTFGIKLNNVTGRRILNACLN